MARVHALFLFGMFACSSRPADVGTVNATLDGRVFATGPVAGVVVSAYALNLDDGSPGDLVAASTPTDESGAYHVDLGSFHGPLLLVARGVLGSFTEPATGVVAHFDSATEFRAAFVARTSAGELRYELESGEAATAIVGPWSEWTVACAAGRLAGRRDATYAEALGHAALMFRDHLELDGWAVAPIELAGDPVGAWNEGVQAGVLLAGLSELATEMATGSGLSAAGLGSLALVAAVQDDLADGVLDGKGSSGPIVLGSCPGVCALGPATLRGDLRDAAEAFLASSANASGIAAADATAFLGRIATRASDLWPAFSKPVVTLVASTFEDDSGVTAEVVGERAGVLRYSGSGQPITFAPGISPSFEKFVTRYDENSPNLPELHFVVGENEAGSDTTLLAARLLREQDGGDVLVVTDWSPVPVAQGNGYNRALILSSALASDLAFVGGTYHLEFRATDAARNQSPVDCAHGIGCVTWTQTLLPPPLRQRAGTDGDACADAAIPTGHTLGGSGPCPALVHTASANLLGPENRKIGEGLIDNPNSMPVTVAIEASAPTVIRRGLRFLNVAMGSAPSVVRSCDRTGLSPVTPSGRCALVQADTAEYETDEILDRDLLSTIVVEGAVTLGADTEGRPIVQLAPYSTATVWLESSPWTFLMSSSPTDFATFGSIGSVTGFVGGDWLRCTQTATGGFGEDGPYCTAQVMMRELTELTRASVQPASSVTLLSRPTDSSDPSFAPATGTNVSGFSYAHFDWDTVADGY